MIEFYLDDGFCYVSKLDFMSGVYGFMWFGIFGFDFEGYDFFVSFSDMIVKGFFRFLFFGWIEGELY